MNDYSSPWDETLKISGKVCMEVNRLRYLCVEIYKAIKNINPSFMKQIFQLRETYRTVQNQYKLNLIVPKVSHVIYGEKSLRYYGSKVCNCLRFMLRLLKFFKLSKALLKIEMIVQVTVECVKVKLN